MTTAFSSIAALLLSVLMLIGGNSLVGIVTPLEPAWRGFPDLTVGLLGSVYFAGMLAGTLAAPAIIRRGGHIRAYAAFVALAVVSVILMPVMVSPWAWLGCPRADRLRVRRALRGDRVLDQRQGDQREPRRALCALPDRELRRFRERAAGAETPGSGRLFPFAVAGALLALAIVPMAMTSVDPPAQPRSVRPRLVWLTRMAPISCVAVFAAGAANGALFALGPIFAVDIGMAPTSAPLFTSSIVLGSALGVFPIAAISDRTDRRLMIAAVTIAGAACEVALSRIAAPGAWLLVLGFLVGLTTYSLYTLAVSLANDDSAPHDLVFISVGLLFIYCVAAIAAPALASVLMKILGPQTLFIQNAYVHMAVAALALWGLLAKPRRTGTQPA